MRITPVAMYRNSFLPPKKQEVGFGKFDKNKNGEEDVSIPKDYWGISLMDPIDREMYKFFQDTKLFTLKRGIPITKKKVSCPYIVKNMEAIEESPDRDNILKLCDKLKENSLRGTIPGDTADIISKKEPDYVTLLNYSYARYFLTLMSSIEDIDRFLEVL